MIIRVPIIASALTLSNVSMKCCLFQFFMVTLVFFTIFTDSNNDFSIFFICFHLCKEIFITFLTTRWWVDRKTFTSTLITITAKLNIFSCYFSTLNTWKCFVHSTSPLFFFSISISVMPQSTQYSNSGICKWSSPNHVP